MYVIKLLEYYRQQKYRSVKELPYPCSAHNFFPAGPSSLIFFSSIIFISLLIFHSLLCRLPFEELLLLHTDDIYW